MKANPNLGIRRFFTAAAAILLNAFSPERLIAIKGSKPQYRNPTMFIRGRTPNSNAGDRRENGLPHGRSGAKLIRKAAAGSVGIARLR